MINIEVHFVGYLYSMYLINALKMERIKVLVVIVILKSRLNGIQLMYMMKVV